MAPSDDNVVSRIQRFSCSNLSVHYQDASFDVQYFVFDASMTDEGDIARINTPEFFADDSKIWREQDQAEPEVENNMW